MKLKLVFGFMLCSTLLFGQDDWLTKALADVGAEKKARLDSLDFQFAMSVNDNSSFIDVQQKGEGWAKGFYSMKPKSQRTFAEIASDTLNWAVDYYNMRWYRIAEAAFITAKNFMEAYNLTQDISYIRCISNMGVMYLIQGRTLEAEQFVSYALAESERLGKGSIAYAANLNSMAKLRQQLGHYNEAERMFTESLASIAARMGTNSLQHAIVLNNIAMLYQVMGRYPEAVEMMKQALVALEASNKRTLQGKKSFDSRKFNSNLALLYQLSGNLAQAETEFLAIRKVFENRGQKNNPEYANLLNQLSLLYIQMNKTDQVEPLLLKAIDVYKKKFTTENPSYAKAQTDLGTFYRVQNRMTEAEVALTNALGIRQRTLGENHPDYIKSVEAVGILYWKKGDLMRAYPFLQSACNKSLEFINQYFAPMSETEKTKYWDILQPRFQRFYNFAIEAGATMPEVWVDVFNYQIATKALLLNSTNKVKKAILASGNEALIKDYISWIGQKEALARYYSLSKEELKEQKIDLVALEKTANELERSLSQRSTDFAKGYESEQISWPMIVSKLADHEAVLELIRVRTFDKDFTDQSRYIALVVAKGISQPRMVLIENGNELETRYAKFYKNAVQQRMADPHSYHQYWEKIDPLLASKKTIYVSPDGVYNQININTLKKTDGDFVLNRFDVVMVGNSKDLIAIKDKKTSTTKSAFVLGFPDYGGNAVALPGTKVEIDEINKILGAGGFKVTKREQHEANEAALKAVAAPTLMHIATHGYFLADSDLKSGDAMGIDAENAKNNPLLRSGLILAGTQAQDNNAVDLQSNDNGILTAYEAMNLSLEGTDLIILSACETGLGDVRAGEGVYGLQRAFLVAGANALIMSLWKVDDAATQQLMTNFYSIWTKTGNKQQAFKQAQLRLMTKYKDPYYWGAFVMMGM
ncbi:MAG: Tetratricopeptide TPR_1 repeat-containing protein [Bacteroidetes bacterium OLB12]|nr:MAG: Tetratricopeptide TPR_1 repeat-containing protein [Bacteroidetes bacterium OLB12]HNU42919.1 CHAT domain-containing protein [Cyclobacteriaceae bacterium]